MTAPLDFSFLASSAIKAISPFLSSLLRGGENAAKKLTEKALEKVGEHMGDEGWNKARSIWQQLEGPIKENPAASLAIEDLAAKPSDEVLLQISTLQLERLLTNNEVLSRTLSTLLDSTRAGATQVFKNEKNATIKDTTIIMASSGAKVINR